MQKAILIHAMIIGAVNLAGCATTSLETHTVNQAMTSTDLRYQLVVDNLARVAACQGQSLPSFAVVTDQISTVTNAYKGDENTMLGPGLKKFKSELLSIGYSTSPFLQWQSDPTTNPDQLVALLAACRWVACPSALDPHSVLILRQFQVVAELQQFPNGWLGIGRKCDVDHHACYIGNCGDVFVWVSPAAMSAFSEFTLVLMDIATVDTLSLQPIDPVTMQPIPLANSVKVVLPNKPRPAAASLAQAGSALPGLDETIVVPEPVPLLVRGNTLQLTPDWRLDAGVPKPEWAQVTVLEPSCATGVAVPPTLERTKPLQWSNPQTPRILQLQNLRP